MSGRAWVTRACALPAIAWAITWAITWAIAWTSLVAAAGGGWHYTIDQARREQQANFCDNKKIIEEIAAVFERFGPRSGYAALSDSPGCAIAVRSFTPRSILLTVTISKGEAGEYRVRFVEVENERGDILYLVTTRDVAAR